MPSRHVRHALPRMLLVTGATTALAFASATAVYAATLDTAATLNSSASTPSVVSTGVNDFAISVWATGKVSQSNTATVTAKYVMSSDGTITPSTDPSDQQALHFTDGYNYSQCPAAAPPEGCAAHPFTITAQLVVPAGATGGTRGTLRVATSNTPGLSQDATPATGYVTVADSNHAPSMPGAPTLDPASTSPNNTGAFTVDWAAAADPDSGDTVTYTLQQRDADDAGWTTVAGGLTGTSYTFAAEPEGSWRYQVQAVDSDGASSAFAADGTPIVVVDTTAPNPPTASADQPAAYIDDDGNAWYKDGVTVSFASAGDPDLADGSAGSGVAAVSSPRSFSATGSFTVSGHATDNATNVSTDTTLSGYVDSAAPTVDAGCPTGTVLLNAGAAATWTASDVGSGLATPAQGSVTLDTSTVGDHTITVPAAVDNVGHSSGTTDCSYHVGYDFSGFLQPINDTAHFVGETTSVFKAGSTVPVKFQLLDANGVAVQAAAAPAWLSPAEGSAVPSSIAVDESSYDIPASSGSFFKWDATSRQYVFNYKADKSQAGHFWRIGVKLDDGSVQYVSVALR